MGGGEEKAHKIKEWERFNLDLFNWVSIGHESNGD